MRLVLCHPGADMSTSDVHRGLEDGLKALGHEVYDYALNHRIAAAAQYFDHVWRKAKKQVPRPTNVDVLYRAGEELVTRALRVQPDVVLIVSAMFLHPDVLVLLKRAGIKVALLLTESPYDDEQQAKLLPFVDVAWTNERASAETLGIHYLPHAWHPQIHVPTLEAANPHVPAHDVVFVGTAFQERIEMLQAVDWRGIDLGLYGAWEMLPARSPLRPYLRGKIVENTLTAALYQRAKIGLNLYRWSKGFGKAAPRLEQAAGSLNPRAYELAATRCFSLSEYRTEVVEKFGDLVPTFTQAAEIRPLVDRWLADDVGRTRARFALAHAVADDTWTARAAQVIDDIVHAGIGARDDATRRTGATA